MNTGSIGSGLPRTTTRPLPLANIAIPSQVIDMYLIRIANSITQPKTIQAKEQATSPPTNIVVPLITRSDGQRQSITPLPLKHQFTSQISSQNRATQPAKPKQYFYPNFSNEIAKQKIPTKQDAHGKAYKETIIPTQPNFWLPVRVLRPNLPHLIQNSLGRWEPAVDAGADEEDIQLLTELVFALKNLQGPEEDLTLMRLDFLAQNNWIENRDLTEEEQRLLNVEYKNNTPTKPVANPYLNTKQAAFSLIKPVPPSILKRSKPFDVTKLHRTENSPRTIKYHFDQVVEKVRFFDSELNSGTIFQQDMPIQIITPICAEDKRSEEINLQKS